MRGFPRMLTAAACLIQLLVAGCFYNSPVIPVRGAVSFEGREPPEVCRLSFLPLASDEGATVRPNGATVDESGEYQLTEHLGVAGLLPGTYRVQVSYYDLKKGGDPNREGDWITRGYEAEELVVPEDASVVDYDIVVPARR